MAKTFYTSGTGSQQTLTGSQDEKVAVYQTLADAEADLANLEAGQIVATPDTGDELAQPVDVVESGNMHAVTSNAVAEQLYNLKIKPFSITIQSVTKDRVYSINFTDIDIGNINVYAFALEFIGGNSAFDYEGCLYCRNVNKQFLYKCGYTQTNLRIYGIVFYTD